MYQWPAPMIQPVATWKLQQRTSAAVTAQKAGRSGVRTSMKGHAAMSAPRQSRRVPLHNEASTSSPIRRAFAMIVSVGGSAGSMWKSEESAT